MKKKVLFIAFTIWIFLFISFVFIKGIVPAWQEERSDFSNYYTSSVLLLKGEAISNFYNNDWFYKQAINEGLKDGAKFAPFPPATAFLYLPLTIFPPLQAKRVWLFCNLLFLSLLIYQLKSISTLNWLETLFIVSLFMFPIASNIRLGQCYLFFTVILLVFLQKINAKKYTFAGFLLGLVASLKYFPIVYFLYNFKNKRKTIIGIISSVALISLLPIIINDTSSYNAFINVFFNHLNGNLSGQGQFSFNFQSVDALMSNLFIYDKQLNPNAVFNLPYLKTIFKSIFTLTVLFFAIKVYKNSTHQTKNIAIGASIIGASLLIPASAAYHLLLLIPSSFLILNFLKKRNNSTKETALIIFLIFISCNIQTHHIPNFEFNQTINILVHFPRLFGLIALFIILYFLNKKHLQTNG
ncbi:MAG: glycosyltransferase family 87 protein [Vicingaceae bacterium]